MQLTYVDLDAGVPKALENNGGASFHVNYDTGDRPEHKIWLLGGEAAEAALVEEQWLALVEAAPMASTRPTTIRWSPPVCTAWIRQSIQAGTASSCGDPVTGAGVWAIPANLSAPLTAKARHSPPCSAPRMLTQNTPARAIRGQVVDVRATMNVTRGGSRDSDAKDWQAKPSRALLAVGGRGGDDGDTAGEVPEHGPELGGADGRALVVADGPQLWARQRIDVAGIRVLLRRGGGGGAD